MRILVTNDDGIDSVGLHLLARAMREHADVVVAAPDREYSGAGAAIGALHVLQPELRREKIEGIDEAWSLSGPPALCVLFSRLGLFGEPFDLVVSGINPGANVGGSVYHSGTVGATLTARNGGISGVAVSQAVSGLGIEGQGWDEMLADMHWGTAATVASAVVGGLMKSPPSEPAVINVNVPNVDLDEIAGWRHAEIGQRPPRSVATVAKTPVPGHEDLFSISMDWGDAAELPVETDGGAVEHNEVAITHLSALQHVDRPDLGNCAEALHALLGPVAR